MLNELIGWAFALSLPLLILAAVIEILGVVIDWISGKSAPEALAVGPAISEPPSTHVNSSSWQSPLMVNPLASSAKGASSVALYCSVAGVAESVTGSNGPVFRRVTYPHFPVPAESGTPSTLYFSTTSRN
jgi:hypothetical protein